MQRVIYTLIIITGIAVACTKDNFIDTGISNGRHEGKNMLEYMATDSYNWDSTILLIRHAGTDMVRLFEGKDPEHEEITFFGITNFSIKRYLLQNELKRVSDLDAAWCRSILLQHVVDKKIYRKDIPVGKLGDYNTIESGGIYVSTLAGTEVWLSTVPQESGGIVDNVAKPIYINFMESNNRFMVASGDIEPDHCLVHALEYSFTLGDEEK